MSSISRISDAERKQLKKFVRLVADMNQSRFIQRARTQKHDIHFERVNAEGFKITAPDYDWEDFRSFLTIFRQIALSKKDSVYLPKIINVIARYADRNLRYEIDEIKAQIFPRLEGKFVGIRFGAELGGNEISLTSYELLDAIVNGVVFHPGQDKDAEAELIHISQPWEYIGILLSEIISPVFNVSMRIMQIIRSNKYLDDTEFAQIKTFIHK